MRIVAALQGDLDKYVEQQYLSARHAITAGMKETTIGLKNAMRDQVRKADLGPSLPTTWRHKIYPEGGKKSINAAGYVFSKVDYIMLGLEKSHIIYPKRKKALAIPTENVPFVRGSRNRERISPQSWEQYTGRKLVYVKRHGKNPLLIDKGQQAMRSKKTGQFRFRQVPSGNKNASRRVSRVMFILVPRVKMPKLISFYEEANKWHNRLINNILKNWKKV